MGEITGIWKTIDRVFERDWRNIGKSPPKWFKCNDMFPPYSSNATSSASWWLAQLTPPTFSQLFFIQPHFRTFFEDRSNLSVFLRASSSHITAFSGDFHQARNTKGPLGMRSARSFSSRALRFHLPIDNKKSHTKIGTERAKIVGSFSCKNRMLFSVIVKIGEPIIERQLWTCACGHFYAEWRNSCCLFALLTSGYFLH